MVKDQENHGSGEWEHFVPDSAFMRQKYGRSPNRTLNAFSKTHQRIIAGIVSKCILTRISAKTSFPAWLGYVGLALYYTKFIEAKERIISSALIPQFENMINKNARGRINTYIKNDGLLTYQDLSRLELYLHNYKE